MKLLHYLNGPIGYDMECAFGVKPKRFIGAAIGAGLGIASSIIGGSKSAKAAKEAQAKLDAQHAKDEAWYTRRYNEDYADTAAGQNLIRQAKDYANENWKKTQGASAVGGATESASAMAKEAGNKMVGNTFSNIAAQDTARKANVDAINMKNQQNYTNQSMAIDQQKANNIANVAGGVSDALFKAGAAFDGFNSKTTAPNVGNSATSGTVDLAKPVTDGFYQIQTP